MSALTANRDTAQLDDAPIPTELALPVAASTHLYAGALVCSNSSGYATKGATSTTLKAVGVAKAEVDNSSGSNGDKTVIAKRGAFYFDMGASADALTIADRFATVYMSDDHTVNKTDATGTRSAAGILLDVQGTQAVVLVGAGISF